MGTCRDDEVSSFTEKATEANPPVPCVLLSPVARRRLPSICIEGFRVIRASESRYKSRDERDYLGQMYSRNEVFATADGESIDELADHLSGHRYRLAARGSGVVLVQEAVHLRERDPA